MKKVNEFIASMVKIEYIERSGGFGHFPFQMAIENKDGSKELHSLSLSNVGEYLRHFKASCIVDKVSSVIMSLDFPAFEDIEHDFVGIYFYENQKTTLVVLPYDVATGQTFDLIGHGTGIDRLINDFNKRVYSER